MTADRLHRSDAASTSDTLDVNGPWAKPPAAHGAPAAKVRLWSLDAACSLLRVRDIPRGRKRWFRVTLWLLEHRYRAALDLRGHDFARRYDYVPF